jgi:hypothetical protein
MELARVQFGQVRDQLDRGVPLAPCQEPDTLEQVFVREPGGDAEKRAAHGLCASLELECDPTPSSWRVS